MGDEHKVVINDEEQYSTLPVHRENPPGWHDTGVVGTQQQCLDHIDQVWQDMRPRSVRERTAATDGSTP